MSDQKDLNLLILGQRNKNEKDNNCDVNGKYNIITLSPLGVGSIKAIPCLVVIFILSPFTVVNKLTTLSPVSITLKVHVALVVVFWCGCVSVALFF